VALVDEPETRDRAYVSTSLLAAVFTRSALERITCRKQTVLRLSVWTPPKPWAINLPAKTDSFGAGVPFGDRFTSCLVVLTRF
jgi:hypothetical protein